MIKNLENWQTQWIFIGLIAKKSGRLKSWFVPSGAVMQTLKVYPTRLPISTSVESSPKGDLEQTLENFKRSILFENRRRTKKNQGQNDGLNFSTERLSAYYIPRVGKIPEKAPNLINKFTQQ